jgi:predicted O-methyltransferase YrrM
MNKENILKDIGLVNRTNAMTPLQIEQIGEILPEKDNISVLEFGAGTSTIKIYEALTTKYKNVNYVTYEHNLKWKPNHEDIEVRMFNKKDLANGKINISNKEKYDIVIVDGPDGDFRKYWYKIFKDNVKEGTILHIDDVFHYPSFLTELNNTFKNYDILFESGRTTWNQKRGPGSGKCWLTLKLKGIK